MLLSPRFAVHQIAERHFQPEGPGTLVRDRDALLAALEAAALASPGAGGTEGQMFVPVPVNCVSGAFTRLESVDVGDIKAHIHRGHVAVYVPREKYPPVQPASAAVILYTRQSIKDDPQWDGAEPEADYVIVAVLAQVSGQDPVSALRFCENLAGGNNRYLAEDYTLDQARQEARRVAEFESTYIQVG